MVRTLVPPPTSDLILYQTEDGRTRIECRFEDETIWLTQAQMSALFEIGVGTVNHHLKDIFAEGELSPEATIRRHRIVRTEGKRSISRDIEHYRLDAILAVGFRVRSHRGTQFRQWATAILGEYLVKGFALDDERHKNPPGRGQTNYFDELLARIRDIRSSERVFWHKVLDIYATSADYDPNAAASRAFFQTVQNKMHWAAHGHTAAEVIVLRADASKPNMGLTSWAGGTPRKSDVGVAKNYLSVDELDALNRIVSMYLEFAELQAKNRRVMYMRDWIKKLDDFLRISDREILEHAGKVSHEAALATAELHYERFRQEQDRLPSRAILDFERAVADAKRLAGPPRPPTPKTPKRKRRP